MKISLNTFWFYVLLVFFVLLLIIVLALWQSYYPHKGQVNVSEAENVSQSPINDSIKLEVLPDIEKTNPSLPAPAKKLQKLTKENPIVNIENAEFSQRVEALNQQIESLNKQLSEQGVFVPQSLLSDSANAQTNDASLSEIAERLRAIKNYIEEKPKTP